MTLRARTDSLVLVTGTVVDANGDPVNRALIYTSDKAAIPNGARAAGRTNRDGMFQLVVPRGTPFLIAAMGGKQHAVLPGPWPRPDTVLRPPPK